MNNKKKLNEENKIIEREAFNDEAEYYFSIGILFLFINFLYL